MKRISPVLLLLVMVTAGYSQVPYAFNYQAILRDSNGTSLVSETVSLQVSIVNDLDVPLYTEVHDAPTNEFGLVNVVIGQGTTSDDMSEIDWADGPYFLDITVDGESLGSSPLLSVPYALYAASGNEGPAGPQGDPGPQGETGLQGPTGEKGDPGDAMWDSISGGIAYTQGRIGIGTEEPAQQLDVEENTRIGGDLFVEGTIMLDTANLAEMFEEWLLMKQMTGIGTVTDIDGNKYRTVKIGEQTWMAENLRTSRYNDGTPLVYIPVRTGVYYDWDPWEHRDYCWRDNDSASYDHIFGKLYFDPTDSLCPAGWHIATIAEWDTLESHLGNNAGGKMKATGTAYWNPPNTGATNETGFSGLPGGSLKFLWGTTYNMDVNFGGGGVWGFSYSGDDRFYLRILSSSKGEIIKENVCTGGLPWECRLQTVAYSVRCIKD